MTQLLSNNREEKICLPASASTDAQWCLSRILDQLDDAVIILDIENEKIIYSNEVTCQIVNSLELDLTFASLHSFLTLRIISFSADSTRFNTQSIIHNDRIIALSHAALDEYHVCIQIQDITERKRLESIAQTVNTMDNLGFIFSGIRHEIGNPLNSIKMTNSVLQKNLDRFSKDDISRYVERTSSEISRMEYLLRALKNFSMYEKSDIAPHCLKGFLETMIKLVEPDLEKRGIHVISTLPSTDTRVDIDPRALHQAILNIVTNAADAVSNINQATIDISTRANGRLAWIVITDNGCGMTEAQMQRLFQPFNTNKPHGNGLGLVITQKLLTMMQATLEIDSNPGGGTTVEIGLPLTNSVGSNYKPEP